MFSLIWFDGRNKFKKKPKDLYSLRKTQFHFAPLLVLEPLNIYLQTFPFQEGPKVELCYEAKNSSLTKETVGGFPLTCLTCNLELRTKIRVMETRKCKTTAKHFEHSHEVVKFLTI